MVKRLVVKTTNPATLLDMLHELGTAFYSKAGQNSYKVLYFASNREVHFEGALSEDQLAKVKGEAQEVKSIKIDEIANEIVIEE